MAEDIHPIDRIVGHNLRVLRTARRVSQADLGRHVGVTFQQVQKYEKGTNRISASTLAQFAAILETDVQSFFREEMVAQDDEEFSLPITEGLATKLDLKIMQRLFELRDVQLKRRLLALIETLADSQGTSRDRADKRVPPELS